MNKKILNFFSPKMNSKRFRSSLIIVLFFIISRFVLYKFFDFEFLYNNNLMQLLDITLLKKNLFQSIIYNHSQPPLFNLIFAISEIIFKDHAKTFNLLLFQILGISTALISYKILKFLQINEKLSLTIVLLYILTPSTILYESWFFYTQIIIFLLILGGYHLLKYSKFKKKLNLLIYLMSIVSTSLITSFFHISWMIVLIALPIIIFNDEKITIFKYSLIPFFIVFSLYFKNYIIFDQFTASSWFGLNFARITVKNLDPNIKSQLISEKKLSLGSLYNGFPNQWGIVELKKAYIQEKTGIEILDEEFKTDSNINYNYKLLVPLSKDVLKDDIFVLTKFSEIYILGIREAFLLYFHSPTRYPWIELNSKKIYTYNKFFDSFIYGAGRYSRTGVLTIFFYPVILIICLLKLFRSSTPNISKLFIIYALINIFYVMFIGNLFELGENNRFRFYTEIFYYILIGIIIQITISDVFPKLKNR